MSDVTFRGGRPTRPAQSAVERVEDVIWPMPTVEEVVKRGYPAAYWDKVKADHDELVRRWNADEPGFREQMRADRAAREQVDREELARRGSR